MKYMELTKESNQIYKVTCQNMSYTLSMRAWAVVKFGLLTVSPAVRRLDKNTALIYVNNEQLWFECYLFGVAKVLKTTVIERPLSQVISSKITVFMNFIVQTHLSLGREFTEAVKAKQQGLLHYAGIISSIIGTSGNLSIMRE